VSYVVPAAWQDSSGSREGPARAPTSHVTAAARTQNAAVAIRQHDIQLSVHAPAASENSIKATVARQVYLGASRDYVVETADGTSLRVVTPTETAVSKGSEVWLTLPPERCRALSR